MMPDRYLQAVSENRRLYWLRLDLERRTANVRCWGPP